MRQVLTQKVEQLQKSYSPEIKYKQNIAQEQITIATIMTNK